MDSPDEPPQYSQVFEMDSRSSRGTGKDPKKKDFYGINMGDPPERLGGPTATEPSAPLLGSSFVPSLDSSFYGFPNSIKFSTAPANDNNSFFIRDTSECLHVKGVVRESSGAVSLTNVNGTKFLDVIPHRGSSTEFDIRHGGTILGQAQMTIQGAVLGLTNLLNPYPSQKYSINKPTANDIVIGRSRTDPPMCLIHLNPSTSPISYEGTLTFPSNAEPTKIEQLLSISVAIITMVAQNKIFTARTIAQAETDSSNEIMGCILGVLFVAIIIILGYFGISALEAAGCRHKKAQGYAGYRNKDC